MVNKKASYIALVKYIFCHILFLSLIILLIVSFQAYRLHLDLNRVKYYWSGRIFQNDEEIGFRLTPNSEGFHILDKLRVPFKIDRFGFRIPISQSKETEIKNHGIIGIGCSFMFGHGIAAEETIVYLLGQELDLPAYNLGVGVYSTYASYLWLKRNIEILKPSIVIYGFNNFHISRSLSPVAVIQGSILFQAFIFQKGNNIQVRSPIISNKRLFNLGQSIEEIYFQHLFYGKQSKFDMQKYINHIFYVLDSYYRRAILLLSRIFYINKISDYDLSFYMFTNILKLCEDNNAKLIVFYMPREYGDRCSEGVIKVSGELSNNNSFLFIDPSEDLFKIATNKEEFLHLFLLWPFDAHPNASWNKEVVKSIIKEANSRNLIPKRKEIP